MIGQTVNSPDEQRYCRDRRKLSDSHYIHHHRYRCNTQHPDRSADHTAYHLWCSESTSLDSMLHSNTIPYILGSIHLFTRSSIENDFHAVCILVPLLQNLCITDENFQRPKGRKMQQWLNSTTFTLNPHTGIEVGCCLSPTLSPFPPQKSQQQINSNAGQRKHKYKIKATLSVPFHSFNIYSFIYLFHSTAENN